MPSRGRPILPAFSIRVGHGQQKHTSHRGKLAAAHIAGKVLVRVAQNQEAVLLQVVRGDDLGHAVLARDEANEMITSLEQFLDFVL